MVGEGVGYYAFEDEDIGQKMRLAVDFVIGGVRTAERVACLEVDRGGMKREAIILAVYSPAFS